MENKYFKVTCKCGHVGVKHYIRISLPVIAATRKGAAEIARYIPRVKHDHKDAILECKEITLGEFEELQEITAGSRSRRQSSPPRSERSKTRWRKQRKRKKKHRPDKNFEKIAGKT